MAFDVDNDRLCDILKAFGDKMAADTGNIASHAAAEGITFPQAWKIIQMSKNLPEE